MEFFGTLVLLLLTLIGYSSGRVLGKHKYVVRPDLFDIVMAIALWIGALGSQSLSGRWLIILTWFIIGMVSGKIVNAMRRSNISVMQEQKTLPLPTNIFKQLWERWKTFSHRMGDFQSRMLLIFFYFIVVSPFGLIVRVFYKPLQLPKPVNSSSWEERQMHETDLEAARNQF